MDDDSFLSADEAEEVGSGAVSDRDEPQPASHRATMTQQQHYHQSFSFLSPVRRVGGASCGATANPTHTKNDDTCPEFVDAESSHERLPFHARSLPADVAHRSLRFDNLTYGGSTTGLDRTVDETADSDDFLSGDELSSPMMLTRKAGVSEAGVGIGVLDGPRVGVTPPPDPSAHAGARPAEAAKEKEAAAAPEHVAVEPAGMAVASSGGEFMSGSEDDGGERKPRSSSAQSRGGGGGSVAASTSARFNSDTDGIAEDTDGYVGSEADAPLSPGAMLNEAWEMAMRQHNAGEGGGGEKGDAPSGGGEGQRKGGEGSGTHEGRNGAGGGAGGEPSTSSSATAVAKGLGGGGGASGGLSRSGGRAAAMQSRRSNGGRLMSGYSSAGSTCGQIFSSGGGGTDSEAGAIRTDRGGGGGSSGNDNNDITPGGDDSARTPDAELSDFRDATTTDASDSSLVSANEASDSGMISAGYEKRGGGRVNGGRGDGDDGSSGAGSGERMSIRNRLSRLHLRPPLPPTSLFENKQRWADAPPLALTASELRGCVSSPSGEVNDSDDGDCPRDRGHNEGGGTLGLDREAGTGREIQSLGKSRRASRVFMDVPSPSSPKSASESLSTLPTVIACATATAVAEVMMRMEVTSRSLLAAAPAGVPSGSGSEDDDARFASVGGNQDEGEEGGMKAGGDIMTLTKAAANSDVAAAATRGGGRGEGNPDDGDGGSGRGGDGGEAIRNIGHVFGFVDSTAKTERPDDAEALAGSIPAAVPVGDDKDNKEENEHGGGYFVTAKDLDISPPKTGVYMHTVTSAGGVPTGAHTGIIVERAASSGGAMGMPNTPAKLSLPSPLHPPQQQPATHSPSVLPARSSSLGAGTSSAWGDTRGGGTGSKSTRAEELLRGANLRSSDDDSDSFVNDDANEMAAMMAAAAARGGDSGSGWRESDSYSFGGGTRGSTDDTGLRYGQPSHLLAGFDDDTAAAAAAALSHGYAEDDVLRASRRMHRRKAQKDKYMQKLRNGFDMRSTAETARRAAVLRRNAHSEPDRDPSGGGRGTWGGKALDVTGVLDRSGFETTGERRGLSRAAARAAVAADFKASATTTVGDGGHGHVPVPDRVGGSAGRSVGGSGGGGRPSPSISRPDAHASPAMSSPLPQQQQHSSPLAMDGVHGMGMGMPMGMMSPMGSMGMMASPSMGMMSPSMQMGMMSPSMQMGMMAPSMQMGMMAPSAIEIMQQQQQLFQMSQMQQQQQQMMNTMNTMHQMNQMNQMPQMQHMQHMPSNNGFDAVSAAAASSQAQEKNGGGGGSDVTEDRVRTVFSLIAANALDEVVGLIDSRAIGVDLTDGNGNSIFMAACLGGHKRLSKHLMKRGATVNHQNSEGQTALHYCLAIGHNELGDYLLAKGASDTIANKYGLTPFEGLNP